MYLFELEFSVDICPGVGLLDHMIALFLKGSFKKINMRLAKWMTEGRKETDGRVSVNLLQEQTSKIQS